MSSQSPKRNQAQIAIFTDNGGRHHEMADFFGGVCGVRVLPLSCDRDVIGESTQCVVIDIDLTSEEARKAILPISRLAHRSNLPVIFVLDGTAKKTLAANLQLAENCGATNVVTRPFDKEAILKIMPSAIRKAWRPKPAELAAAAGVRAARDVLSMTFEKLRGGRPVKFEDVIAQDHIILNALLISGIRAWLETVRRHHNRTYIHSLLVTGVAVAFAQQLGMRPEDQKRIVHAALVHDVGKAFVSLDILDKPGKLTDEEMRTIKEHPVLGHQCLVAQGGFPDEVLDCVLHHHELLDGSGYPHRLEGAQISDLVRIITIADIFSALIERRSYKPPLPARRALEIMENMTGQLDPDLLREFRAVALKTE